MKYVNICILFLLKVQKRCLDALLFLNWESDYIYLWFGDILDGDHIRETLRKKILFKFLLRHTVSGTWKMAFWEDDSISNYIFFRIDCGIWKQVFSRQLSIRAINPLFYKYTKSSPMPLLHANIYWLRGKTSPKKVWEFFKEENPMSRKIISKIETQTWFLKTGRFWKDLTSMCRRVT